MQHTRAANIAAESRPDTSKYMHMHVLTHAIMRRRVRTSRVVRSSAAFEPRGMGGRVKRQLSPLELLEGLFQMIQMLENIFSDEDHSTFSVIFNPSREKLENMEEDSLRSFPLDSVNDIFNRTIQRVGDCFHDPTLTGVPKLGFNQAGKG